MGVHSSVGFRTRFAPDLAKLQFFKLTANGYVSIFEFILVLSKKSHAGAYRHVLYLSLYHTFSESGGRFLLLFPGLFGTFI